MVDFDVVTGPSIVAPEHLSQRLPNPLPGRLPERAPAVLEHEPRPASSPERGAAECPLPAAPRERGR
jgi:hypothetical protein